MKEIKDKDFDLLVRCGKVLAKRKYYTEDVKTANAIRQVVVLVRRLMRNTKER